MSPSRSASAPLFRTLAVLLLSGFLAISCANAGDSDAKLVTGQPPGADAYPETLRQRLEDALRAEGEDYEPRTEHLRDDGSPVYTNRLILEPSPYLRQHAHNPVDWYPWGEEAFARAKREGKPIFLSIGYSTCHWCHVMERESFEDEEIARLLNENFVPIKMDREQRPDVDEIYMTAVQILTGRGGWPMSSFLTPELKPFFGGTYFPPQNFAALLQNVSAAWVDRRDELLQQAERLSAAVSRALAAEGAAGEVGREMIERAVDELVARHDAEHGGFSPAPKFPNETYLLFLLEQALRHGRADALQAATHTLDAMARGGIYDQVGGGFHRYSVDGRWLVPHFEKMLYNQAHLSRAYTLAYELTGEPSFARVARQTLDYVLREMTAPEGGFYSATDADSEGEEGRFFVWTPQELAEVLGTKDAALVSELYGVSAEGNFEGRNILHLPQSLDAVAAGHGLERSELLARLDPALEKLRRAREEREHPLRDDKILTSWNAMMITALAQGAEALDEPRYRDAAVRAAEFLWRVNRRDDGSLWRLHLDGRSSTDAVLDDDAHLAQALIALHDLTSDAIWLERAAALADGMVERFWDDRSGAFFTSAEGSDPYLLARPKSAFDGAQPSGNAVAIRALAQLWNRTGERRFRDRMNAALAALASAVERAPAGTAYLLLAVEEKLEGAAGRRDHAALGKVLAEARLEPLGERSVEARVTLKLQPGWHVNADQPLQDNLIPTLLQLSETGDGAGDDARWRLSEVRYPAAQRVQLGFQDEPLAVYSGTVEIRARVERTAPASVDPGLVLRLDLQVQPCDDEACLRPVTVALEIPAGTLRSDILP